jgi:hypothetical protein
MIKIQSYISEHDREYAIRLLKHWRQPWKLVIHWNKYRCILEAKK